MKPDEEDHLLSAFNSYRQTLGVPPLTKHDKAGCLADEIAENIENRPCPPAGTIISAAPGLQPQLDNYPDLVKKCGIDINTTQDGVILPVCVPKRVATLVLTNYTQSQYARYLNNSRYNGIGIGKEDDWTVVVLASNTPAGSFASTAVCLCSVFSYHVLAVLMVLGMFLVVLN
ncbi:hypothetical protein M9H77_27691 [Catharanthus roseus]|uniref:Uncharacterized protein n=1 Tax=Catharanthus roseus TaxID=4058 RepID=A0ACC0AHI7_CATRO|nr:hypothetical protein M9H77_27691 [Catharanthus roseus]